MAEITARLEEARESLRHRVFLWAMLAQGDGLLTTDCILRDWSESGAKIELPPQVALPREVWLVEKRLPLTYESRVVWRRGPLVGLAFLHRHSLDNPDDPRLVILRRLWAQHLPRVAGEE
ncbi:MAG: PilZ domain-containing protein [Caulobacteraceae bacterium]